MAKGSETEEQRALLVELGCTHGQGFLFSDPIPSGDVGRVVRTLVGCFQA